VVLPAGIVSTGYPSVRETCRAVGITFDPWQNDLNRCILAKTEDGLLAADTVVLSIARQVGKTFDIGAIVFAVCIANPDTTVVWTAHRFKVSRETFNQLRALAKSPKLTPHIDYDAITTAAGNETIPFRNGSRIIFAARERGAIRGFTKVKILILDEAQILTHAALADLAPTMNQAEDPQIILMGTPPKPTDPGEVFTDLRSDALAGDSQGLLYVEFSAEPGSSPDDREAWRQANPSYPARTSDRAILRLRKLLSDEDFLREALGIWDSSARAFFSVASWVALEDIDSRAESVQAFAVEVSLDRSVAAIGMAGARLDGVVHVEAIEQHRGTGWVVARCQELDAAHGPTVFAVDGGGPANSLIGDLEAAGLKVVVAQTRDVGIACAGFVDAVEQRSLRHGPQPELASAVVGAKKRPLGDGAFAFGRKASGVDISALQAVTLAHWAATTHLSDMSPINNVW